MQHLPCEIIQKIAFLCVENLTGNLYMRLHVLSPSYISINCIFNLSLCSKELYSKIWKDNHFWKTMFNTHFNSLALYINDENYKSFIIKAMNEYYLANQCNNCKYFSTDKRITHLICNTKIIITSCKICFTENKHIIYY